MKEKAVWTYQLRSLLTGAGWSHEKVDGVMECLFNNGKSHCVFVAQDEDVTTVRPTNPCAMAIGVARRNPSDPFVKCVGIALACERAAHAIRGRA